MTSFEVTTDSWMGDDEPMNSRTVVFDGDVGYRSETCLKNSFLS